MQKALDIPRLFALQGTLVAEIKDGGRTFVLLGFRNHPNIHGEEGRF